MPKPPRPHPSVGECSPPPLGGDSAKGGKPGIPLSTIAYAIPPPGTCSRLGASRINSLVPKTRPSICVKERVAVKHPFERIILNALFDVASFELSALPYPPLFLVDRPLTPEMEPKKARAVAGLYRGKLSDDYIWLQISGLQLLMPSARAY